MTLPPDEFRGDNAKLVGCIEALIALSDDGALVPHGLGGHARSLLAAAANRLTAAEALAGREGVPLTELEIAQARGDAWRDKFDADTTEIASLRMIVKLLVAGGFVTQEKVDEATQIASEVWPTPSRAVGGEVGDRWIPINGPVQGVVNLYFPDIPGEDRWAVGIWKGRWHYDGRDFDQNSRASIMTPYFYDEHRRIFVDVPNRRPTHWRPLPADPGAQP